MVSFGSTNLDQTFGALSDPIRRAVLARLARGECSVGELATEHPISLPAFLKHLKVLEGAGLVESEKLGRVRTCRLSPTPLDIAREWLDQHRRFWQNQLESLERYLIETDAPVGVSEEDAPWPSPTPPHPPSPRLKSAARSPRRASASSKPGRKPRL